MVRAFLLGTLLFGLAGCAGETPIRKTNCWSGMTLLEQAGGDCEFRDVPEV
ncbi:hypothetical protein RGQ15_22095 [Paracoccus sp. MBLB3053]|uniref:Uncharacterized protein n=1 Tax=Paracoccus aurantius TaxID=3073814 RepID=A0ABU2HYX6_9RHOB|nr:hypothetical protein [Paracoccus sp. MBLB3053]MDS9470241.1 hypothetical protein [Paracoccus sp. MBLB3053]